MNSLSVPAMSDMPARTFSEADRSQQTHPQHHSTSNAWSPYTGSKSSKAALSAAQPKRMAVAGSSSPQNLHRRPWDSPPRHSVTGAGQESAEEDELSDEVPPNRHDGRNPGHQRTASTKRKEVKLGQGAPSPKRSKRVNAESSPTTRVSLLIVNDIHNVAAPSQYPINESIDTSFLPVHPYATPSSLAGL